MFATDEHRIGLKPVLRRVWAPVGERPTASGHHRFEWLYVTVFVAPASGETFWYVSNGVSKPFFEELLVLFAKEAGAGRERSIVLELDNAGWHGEPGLRSPATPSSRGPTTRTTPSIPTARKATSTPEPPSPSPTT